MEKRYSSTQHGTFLKRWLRRHINQLQKRLIACLFRQLIEEKYIVTAFTEAEMKKIVEEVSIRKEKNTKKADTRRSYTIQEAADMLGWHISAIKEDVKAGKLKALYKAKRIRAREIDQHLKRFPRSC
jgi:hypothetical protein